MSHTLNAKCDDKLAVIQWSCEAEQEDLILVVFTDWYNVHLLPQKVSFGLIR